MRLGASWLFEYSNSLFNEKTEECKCKLDNYVIYKHINPVTKT